MCYRLFHQHIGPSHSKETHSRTNSIFPYNPTVWLLQPGCRGTRVGSLDVFYAQGVLCNCSWFRLLKYPSSKYRVSRPGRTMIRPRRPVKKKCIKRRFPRSALGVVSVVCSVASRPLPLSPVGPTCGARCQPSAQLFEARRVT